MSKGFLYCILLLFNRRRLSIRSEDSLRTLLCLSVKYHFMNCIFQKWILRNE
ncbi:hypothetical protein HMPREF1145_1773 [Oribacterium parvum ACB8]|nr:hypothetical protein HMPREF1145_1773 [Oribacterium parvum ACB8]